MTSLTDVIGSLHEQGRAPLYQQLQRALRDAITANRLAADEALPPERDIAEEFGVLRIGCPQGARRPGRRRAVDRCQGAGTFVAARVEKSFSKAVVVHRKT